MPTSASSRPGSSWLLPTSCEMLVADTARHLLAVDGRGQVELDEVAVRRRPLDRLERGEALAQAVDLVVDLLVVDHDRSTVTSMVAGSGSVISGRTSTSAVKLQRLPVGELGDLHLGPPERSAPRARGPRPAAAPGSLSWTASVRMVPRPTRWSITAAGTLPLRKPGMVTCAPISRYAFLQARLAARRTAPRWRDAPGSGSGSRPCSSQAYSSYWHEISRRPTRGMTAATRRRPRTGGAHESRRVGPPDLRRPPHEQLYESGWRDLNPRPLAPKASALPSCATPRGEAQVYGPVCVSLHGIPPATLNGDHAAVAQWQSLSLPN